MELEPFYWPNDFHMYFPVFSLMDEVANQPVTVTNKGERTMMVFTDADLAERFIAGKAKAGIAPFAILHPESLLHLIEKLKTEQGVTHVGIDVSFFPSQARYWGGPIDRFIAFVQTWKASGDN